MAATGTCSLSPTECTPILIQLCLRSRIRLWEKYYHAPFDTTYHFSSNMGFTNIVVRSTGTVCARTMGTCRELLVLFLVLFNITNSHSAYSHRLIVIKAHPGKWQGYSSTVLYLTLTVLVTTIDALRYFETG